MGYAVTAEEGAYLRLTRNRPEASTPPIGGVRWRTPGSSAVATKDQLQAFAGCVESDIGPSLGSEERQRLFRPPTLMTVSPTTVYKTPLTASVSAHLCPGICVSAPVRASTFTPLPKAPGSETIQTLKFATPESGLETKVPPATRHAGQRRVVRGHPAAEILSSWTFRQHMEKAIRYGNAACP